jgi:hypothetical protein
MFVEVWSFVLSCLFRKKDRNCLICLENGFTKKLPCNICLNKYIHKKCLNSYFEYNEDNIKCFVCNTGNLTFSKSIQIPRLSNLKLNCLLPDFKLTCLDKDYLNILCLFLIKLVKFLFIYLLGFITSSIIILVITNEDIQVFLLILSLLFGGIIGIIYWFIYKQRYS